MLHANVIVRGGATPTTVPGAGLDGHTYDAEEPPLAGAEYGADSFDVLECNRSHCVGISNDARNTEYEVIPTPSHLPSASPPRSGSLVT